MSRRLAAPLMILSLALISGCDMLGIESAQALADRKEADGKAVGGACRHAGRALEDCFALNRKSDKASVFAGWREMNDYMRENKIDEVAPQAGTNTQMAGKPAPDKAESKDDAPAKTTAAGKHQS
jgi:hypothetical protein